MTRKKILTAAALCMALVLTAVGGTLAWLSANANAKNTVTIGNVTIAVEEPSWQEGTPLAPGSVVAKDPQVKNTGKNPCYVRVRIEETDSEIAKYIIYDKLAETDWVKGPTGSDGVTWYYYTGNSGVLAVDATTKPLFAGVKLDGKYIESSVATDDQPFTIDVYAEAVQSENTNIDASRDLVPQLEALFGEVQQVPSTN